MIKDLRFSLKTSEVYHKFLNWLEAEFDLYQTEVIQDTLYIDYPLINCKVTREHYKNEVIAIFYINAQSQVAFNKFNKYITDIYLVIERNYKI